MNIYKEQATVRVWRNVKTLKKVPTSHFGHAAVTVAGSKVGGLKQHISFWPGNYASKGNAIRKQPGGWNDKVGMDNMSEMNTITALRLEVGYCKTNGIDYPPEYDEYLREINKTPIGAARPGQKRLGITGDFDGVELPLWSQSAEEKIPLPGTDCGDRIWGLSLQRMGQWWTQFKTTAPFYQALGRQNCAGVALDALKQGGSEAFVPCLTVMIYGEPVQVEQYAKLLQIQFDRMEEWSKELDADIVKAVTGGKLTVAPGGAPADGIWDLKKWKSESALGTFQMRSSTIRQIDDAVAMYHEANWGDKFAIRYKALVDAFLAIAKHRQEKADSQRSQAALRLGSQILAIMRNPKKDW